MTVIELKRIIERLPQKMPVVIKVDGNLFEVESDSNLEAKVVEGNLVIKGDCTDAEGYLQ